MTATERLLAALGAAGDLLATPTVQNGIVLLIGAGAVWLWRRAARREIWRDAWRQLTANRLTLAALVMLALYAAIGILDSVSWYDRLLDANGTPAVDARGAPLYEAEPASVLDRCCTLLRRDREKTYSAPLASVLFGKEMITSADGSVRRDYPALAHPRRHLLGTTRIGDDVLYEGLKGVRTALLIGGFTTLLVIPLAILFGIPAGYIGGWIDDVVQYVYTTLESVPDILLIASFILLFHRGTAQLCIILGITSWTGLCRLLRAETLKLRELEYVQAARALGASPVSVMFRHILPNVMHIVVITFVLRFSRLVLTEAVLSYLNLGVSPGTGSWGHMINAARQELTRDPVVWWNLATAFVFMFTLVLSANLFGDALRDALDPRLRNR